MRPGCAQDTADWWPTFVNPAMNIPGSKKGSEFLHYVSSYWTFKKDPVPKNFLFVMIAMERNLKSVCPTTSRQLMRAQNITPYHPCGQKSTRKQLLKKMTDKPTSDRQRYPLKKHLYHDSKVTLQPTTWSYVPFISLKGSFQVAPRPEVVRVNVVFRRQTMALLKSAVRENTMFYKLTDRGRYCTLSCLFHAAHSDEILKRQK